MGRRAGTAGDHDADKLRNWIGVNAIDLTTRQQMRENFAQIGERGNACRKPADSARP